VKTVIIADGGREQLAEWAGGWRHLIELDGEPLLHRTVRQYANHGEVVVLGPPEYQVPPARTIQPEPCEEWDHIAMFAKTLPYWGDERTNLVFGDVWFSDRAVETIVEHDGDWRVFGRPKPSKWTGTRWGEYFCFTLYPEHKGAFKNAMMAALHAFASGAHHRVTPWEVYYAMEGLPFKITGKHAHTGPHWTTIDDWTDDFDFIEDVERWRKRRRSRSARSTLPTSATSS